MLSVRDYVYSMENGLGIVTEVKGTNYTVSYEKSTETVEQKDVTEISPELVEQVKNQKFRDFFKAVTLKKGEDYSEEGRVDSYYVSGHNISGTVTGTETYKVNMSFNNGSFRSRCTCPVGAFCKHSAAVLISVSDDMKNLTHPQKLAERPAFTAPASKSSEKTEITPDVEVLIRKLDDTQSRYGIMNLGAYISLGEMMLKRGTPFMEAILSYMDTYNKSKRYYFTAFKRLFSVNPKISSDFQSLKPEYKFGVFGKEITRTNSRDKDSIMLLAGPGVARYVETELALCYYTMNDRYPDAMAYLLRKGYTNEIRAYLPDIFRHEKPDEAALESYMEFIRRNGDVSEASDALMEKMSEEEKRKLLDNCPFIHVSLDELRKLTFDRQMDLLMSRPDFSDEEMNYILNKYYTMQQFDAIKAARLLVTLGVRYGRYQRNVIELLKGNKDTQILADFLKGNLKEETDSLGIFRYFDTDYTIQDIGNDYTVLYEMKCGELVLSDVYRTSEGYSSDTVGSPLSTAEKLLVSHVEETEKFQRDFRKTEAKILKRNEERRRQELSAAISSFAGELSISNNILLNESHKMHVEATVYTMEVYYESMYFISFRVGNEKLYVVKDTNEFLDAVRDSVTLRYGKGLEFCHRIDNFDESSRCLLNFFLSLPYTSFQRDAKKGLALSKPTLTALFEAMKGKYIIYYGNPVLLRLEETEPVVRIDRNYKMSTSFGSMELLDLDTLYLYNPLTHVIDKVKGSRDEIRFYRFAYNNEGMDVSLVRQQFIDSIYCRFFNQIEIAEEVQKDFMLSDLVINAYFDFDSKCINLRTELLKNDVPVSLENVTAATDAARLSYFGDFMKSLGFEDGKIVDEENIYSFFTMDFTELRNICNVFLSDSITNKTILKMDNPTVRIQYNNNMMEMFMEESDYSEEELFQILEAIRKRKKYVLLKNDRIVDVNNEESREFLDTVDDLGMDEKHLYSVTEAPLYQSLKAYAHMENVSIDDYVRKMMGDITHFKENPMDLPSVNATLRDYQKDGYRWLSVLSGYKMGGILADDMGLGKTLEIITLLKGDAASAPSLIVCPKSLIFNWISEFEHFDPETKVIKLYGSAPEREAIISSIPKDEKIIYVTGYDSLRNDIEKYQDITFNYIVIDEAQAIKNVHAGKSKSVKSLTAIHKFALTGTPIENNVIDLWSIFDFLMPGYFPDLSTFKSSYESSETYTAQIAKKVAPFILRRTKTEVLKDLPPKFERILSVDMTPAQRKIYDAHIMEARNALMSGGKAFDMLPYLMRLRQICVDPKTFIDNYADESGKMNELYSLIPEYIADGHRILLFSTFVTGLNLVEEYLKSAGISYLMLTGDTKIALRQEYVNQFNSDTKIKVFLISLKAGGTGLNLVGADTVIHLDPWWNVSAENQATDRAYRIGQTKNVEVIKLVCEDSIEQRVIELQNLKKDIIDKIIAKDDTSITSFSLEDLSFILG